MNPPSRLFSVVMGWTIFTTVFAWLPIVRIVGRAEGYEWHIGAIGGTGTEGPWWVLVVLPVYAFTMVYTGWRGPRGLFRVLLLVWHLALAGLVVFSAVRGGFGASWEGQGLHWSVPMPIVAVPIVILTGLVVAWVIRDRRQAGLPVAAGWAAANTRKLIMAIALLPVAIVLFRLGTNYNWVTAVAILVTIPQWLLLLTAFEPAPRGDRAYTAENPAPRASG